MRARLLKPDGTYARVAPANGREQHESQQYALAVRTEPERRPSAPRVVAPPPAPQPVP
jgi:hypothetical protein